jgi:hypothetical protein
MGDSCTGGSMSHHCYLGGAESSSAAAALRAMDPPALLFLSSSGADVTGATVPVDGGQTAV